MRLILILLLTSCAQNKVKQSFVEEVKLGNISNQTILDLARTSYLRGCVESKKYWYPEKNHAPFPKCLKMAKEHEKDIDVIINQELLK